MTFKEFQRLRTGVSCLEETAGDPSFKGVNGYTYDGLYISMNGPDERKGGLYRLFIFRDQWDHNDLERLERILWTFYLVECADLSETPLGRDDIGHYVTACFDAAEDQTIDFSTCRPRFDAAAIPDDYAPTQIDLIIYKGKPLPGGGS